MESMKVPGEMDILMERVSVSIKILLRSIKDNTKGVKDMAEEVMSVSSLNMKENGKMD